MNKNQIINIFAIPAVLVGIATFLVYCWPWLSENSEDVRNIALFIFAVLGTPLAIWRTSIASRNNDIATENTKIANKNAEIANKNAEATNRNAEINDRNSFTNMFTQAIDQLGAISQDKPNFEVRLGAIYSLEKLSQANLEYYQPIIDILASYVRQNAPIPPEDERSNGDKVRQDVQTAVTVIGRRKLVEGEPKLNLTHVYLPNVDLTEADLIEANLTRAHLNNANLVNANLTEARLHHTNLTRAKCLGANLTKAQCLGVNLTGAQCIRVNLTGANLINSNLTGAPINGSNLTGTNLWMAIALTCDQLTKADNWQKAYRIPELACGADIPEICELHALGNQGLSVDTK